MNWNRIGGLTIHSNVEVEWMGSEKNGINRRKCVNEIGMNVILDWQTNYDAQI